MTDDYAKGKKDYLGIFQFGTDVSHAEAMLLLRAEYPYTVGRLNGGAASLPWYWGVDWQKMPDTLSGKPFPVFATGVANGLVSHYHVDQTRYVNVIGILGRDQSMDIDLIDADGVPVVDPSVPPMAVCRYAFATDLGGGFPANDYIDDRQLGTWTDAFVNMPNKANLATKNAVTWRCRLNRNPVPHWRLTISTTRIEAFPPTGVEYRFGVRLGILGNYSGPHTNYLLGNAGSSWDVGRYRVETQCQKGGNDVESLDVVNGTAGDWGRPILGRGHVDVAASSSASVYPRYPTGTNIGTASYSGLSIPMVRVLAHGLDTTSTAATETTWQPTSLGLGADDRTIDPMWTANVDKYGHYSELAYDAGNSEWKLTVYNMNPTYTKSFYSWWLGV